MVAMPFTALSYGAVAAASLRAGCIYTFTHVLEYTSKA